MKKVLFIAAVALASLASCKKDRTCTCTTSGNGYTGTAQVTTYTDSKKASARANCLSSTTVDSNGDTWTTTCDLK